MNQMFWWRFGNFIGGLKILGNKNWINPSHLDCVEKVFIIIVIIQNTHTFRYKANKNTNINTR